MESGKVGHWLQVAANIGILAGLLLVGGQMMQSNTLAASQLFSESVDSQIARQLAQLGEQPDASMRRVMYEPDDATKDDYFIADLLYDITYRQLIRAQVLYDSDLYGPISRINPEGFAGLNYRIFACPFGISWLDQRILMNPNNEYLKQFREMAASNPEISRIEGIIGALK
jgi:hypothetical protein